MNVVGINCIEGLIVIMVNIGFSCGEECFCGGIVFGGFGYLFGFGVVLFG